MYTKYFIFFLFLLSAVTSYAVNHQDVKDAVTLNDWSMIEKKSRGQKITFFAWGGDPAINAYLEWVAEKLYESHGIQLDHIKINSTSDAVSLMLAQNRNKKETVVSPVDLIWVNGKNFAILKENGLLLEEWLDNLPNFRLLNSAQRPYLTKDFGVPIEGSELPWGQANLTFYYNSQAINYEELPNSPNELLLFSEKYPDRFTYPAPPEFVGVSFLKQILMQFI